MSWAPQPAYGPARRGFCLAPRRLKSKVTRLPADKTWHIHPWNTTEQSGRTNYQHKLYLMDQTQKYAQGKSQLQGSIDMMPGKGKFVETER